VLLLATMWVAVTYGGAPKPDSEAANAPVARVNIVRTYERVGGVVLPVLLESEAELRMFGRATLRMTYDYAEIDGRAVTHARQALAAY
jgi:hypothetical protein